MFLSDGEFRLFREHIESAAGVQIPWNRRKTLEVSLLARMQERGIRSFNDYHVFLQQAAQSREELEALLSLLVINETSFMRQEYQFRTLRETVLPEIARRKLMAKPRDVRKKEKTALNIWSCGCSSGEEPYSLALTLLESLPFKALWDIEILGTDVDREALKEAQAGIYRDKSLRLLDKSLVGKYFVRNEKSWMIRDEVKAMVSFRFHNLMEQPYPRPRTGLWDIIFCRNVLIYFRLPADNLIIQGFYDSLAPGGYLFLGYSETLSKFTSDFVLRRDQETFYYEKVPGVKGRHLIEILAENDLKAAVPKAPAKPQPATCDHTLEDAHRLHECGDLDGAQAICRSLLLRGLDEEESRLLLARILLDRGELENSLVECEKVLDRNPMSAHVYFMKGLIFINLRLDERAADQFRKAIYLNKNFMMAHFYLAELHRSRGRTREALKHYRNAIQILKKLDENEAPEFSGGFSRKILLGTCERNILNLQT
jgi:chemotaxis protein methyltransferase CheR